MFQTPDRPPDGHRHLVDLVGQLFFGKDLPHDVAPPVRRPITDLPIQIAIDQADGVEENGSRRIFDRRHLGTVNVRLPCVGA